MAKKGNVLVVDDEEIMREVLESLLSQDGYRVDLAKTGEEGLAKLSERPSDVILLPPMRPSIRQLRPGNSAPSIASVNHLRMNRFYGRLPPGSRAGAGTRSAGCCAAPCAHRATANGSSAIRPRCAKSST
jgi:hypothetical protein